MAEFIKVKWADVAEGDVVYIDNYCEGMFPKANPLVSGPYRVVHGNGCGQCLASSRGSFMFYPERLLKKQD